MGEQPEVQRPSEDAARAVVAYLQYLEAPADAGSSVFDRFRSSDRTNAFLQTLHDAGFVQPFDWMAWTDAAQYEAHPELADLAAVVRLTTTLVRRDRFVGGTAAGAVYDGTWAAIVRRIAELYRLG